MNKTLYLGYYDYSYRAKAFVVEDNKLIEYNLTDKELEYFHILIDCLSSADEMEEAKSELYKYFQMFDNIIACEDGEFFKVK